MVKSRDSFEELIYKNSKNTFRTHSRTCSSISKLYSESLLLMLKKRPTKDNYYESKGKLKRDLSIATDFCILRNYCKNNRDKLNIKKGNESSYNETKAFFVNEHVCDKSFDGVPKTRLNFDLTTLIIDNLKSLVNDWIRKHLLDNNETKEKIESVLNTIMHKLDVKSNTSSCTYAIDVLVDPNLNDLSAMRNAKTTTIKHISSITSMITLPQNDNYLKVMSTLSVPRHFMQPKINKPKEQKYNKFIAKLENKIEIRQSSAKVSTFSIENQKRKCCVQNQIQKNENSPNLITQEESETKMMITTQVNRLNYDPMSNICKEIHHNLLDKEDTYSLKINTETKKIETHSNEYNKKNTNKKLYTHHRKLYRKTIHRDKRKRRSVHNNSKHKVIKKDEMVKHIKDIFDCISFVKEINKVKIAISINVLPKAKKESVVDEKLSENKVSKVYAPDKIISSSLLNRSHINKSQQIFFTTKGDIVNSTPNLMTLLDSADSKQNIFSNDNNLTNTDANYLKKLVNKDHETNGREIATEIRELKEIVRSLATTAKEMLETHLTAVGDKNKNTNSGERQSVNQESTSKTLYQKQSKPVQISQSVTKCGTASKIDVNKRDSTSTYNRNIYQKSTSYRLFDSETILRVTDMTSGANSTLVDENSDTFETIQESGSSIDSAANRRKLYAYYYDSIKQGNIYHRHMQPHCSSGVYYVLSQVKNSDTQNTAVSSENSGSSKKNNTDVEGKSEESKKRIFNCFTSNFQRRFTLSMCFIVPFIIVMSLVYLYLRGQFAFRPSPTIFATLTDKRPLNRTELGFR